LEEIDDWFNATGETTIENEALAPHQIKVESMRGDPPQVVRSLSKTDRPVMADSGVEDDDVPF
jgi:hypothetical protein